VGSPFQDHARVSFAVKVGTLKPMANKAKDREWHQKITMKQWQGISHQIDDPLRVLARQSLDRLQQGKGDTTSKGDRCLQLALWRPNKPCRANKVSAK